MKIFGEELGGIGRWYIALPPLLLIGFLIGLFFLAAAGQSRLNAANERVHDSQLRQQALSEFIALISDAESGQRGYLLTGESSYLQPYTEAVTKVEAALDRVHQAYGGRDDSREFQELRILTGKKLGELAAATAQWQADYQMSRWVSAAGVILNIGLVLLATHLVYGDMRRRARQATNLRDQKQELERQVDERTRELTALSTHLQGVSEEEKSALSRELHDELGGLLVAARMDLSWLQQRLPTTDPSIEQRFKRIHDSLSAGVDLKRRVVEELRPTLLDNMGLFTALRWQLKETCRRTGLRCTETIPESELKFSPEAAIGVFRIAQEALTNILKHSEAKSADLFISIDQDTFTLRITDDGKGIPSARLANSTSHGLVSMRHRIAGLRGTWDLGSPGSGGTMLTARIPLARMLPQNAQEGGEQPLASLAPYPLQRTLS